MKNAEFLRAIQSRAARSAVGASAARGRGNAGVVRAARAHLRNANVRKLVVSPKLFERRLDQETDALCAALPRGARHWGVARKLLNIFLRDCLYTTYLEAEYRLRAVEKLLEIPLDSVTAKTLKRASGRGGLPRWRGVRHLTPSESAAFQAEALSEAKRRGIARVHLDAFMWSQSRDEDAA